MISFLWTGKHLTALLICFHPFLTDLSELKLISEACEHLGIRQKPWQEYGKAYLSVEE